MTYILIILKIVIVLNYIFTILMISNFKKEEPTSVIQLDLLSRLEIFAVLGINLVGVISVIDKTTYSFTCGLCIVGILLHLFEHYRFIFASDKKVLLQGKTYSIKEIKKLSTGLFTLQIHMKNKKIIKVYVPLTSNFILKDKIEKKLRG